MVARTDLRPTRADDSLKKLLNKVANPQTVPHGVKVARPGEYVDFYATNGTAHRWDGDTIAEYDNRITEGAAAVTAAQAHLAEVEADLAEAKERITASNGDLTLYVQRVEEAQATANAANAALNDLEASFDIVADKAKSFGFESGQRYYSPITYVWPDFYKQDSKWSKYLEFGHTLGLVIMNRSSGDWSVYDQDFHTQAQKAQSAGAKKILFYIKTLYGAATDPPKYAAEFNQPLSETEKYTHDYIVSTMKRVKAEYPDVFGGVFLDEAVNGWGNQVGRVEWYKELYQKLKVELGRQTVIVINPGANTVPEMMDACDIVMSYESTATKYIDPNNIWVHPDHYRQFPSWRFWHVIHDVVPEDIEEVFKKLDELGIGHAFITDRVLDLGGGDAFNPDIHPYDTPPSGWVVAQITSWIQGTLPFRRDIDAVRELASAPVTVDRLVITEELAARVVNAMTAQVKNLVVTESAILQHTTLLGETVAEQLNVTKTLVARDAIVDGTLDVAQLNVTGDMAAQMVSAMSLESKKLIVTEDAILNRATVVQSLVTPELIADKINVNNLGARLVTAGAIQTDMAASRGVKITNAGVNAWDANGVQTIRLNGSDNLLMGQFSTGDSTVGRIRVFNAVHPVNQRPSGFITIQDAGGITASQGVVEYNNSTLQLSIKDGTEQGYSQPFRKGIMVTRDGLVLAGDLTLSGLFTQTESFQAQSNGPYTINASSYIDVTISFPSSGNRPYIIPSVSFDDAADVNLSLWNVTTTSARIRVYNSSQKTVRGLYVDAIILPLKR